MLSLAWGGCRSRGQKDSAPAVGRFCLYLQRMPHGVTSVFRMWPAISFRLASNRFIVDEGKRKVGGWGNFRQYPALPFEVVARDQERTSDPIRQLVHWREIPETTTEEMRLAGIVKIYATHVNP